MDVKSDFIHGYLNEEIYMEQPPCIKKDSTIILVLFADEQILVLFEIRP